MDLLLDLYFNLLSVSTEANKKNDKRFNLINLEGSDALKRQKYDTWIAMWLSHFENDVIWTVFKLVLKLHSNITVLWRFCRISVISEFPFLGIGLKTKTRKSRKTFFFWVYKVQL